MPTNREYRFWVRLNEQERKMLEAYMQRYAVSRSEAIREALRCLYTRDMQNVAVRGS